MKTILRALMVFGAMGAAVQAADVVQPLTFSPYRGLFFTNINVVITTATTGDDVSIRYTLDSDDPTTSSPLFSGSILVASSVVVRARAFKPDYQPTDIDTHTFIFPADVLQQPTNPPGFPPVWYDAAMTSTTVADYAMDPVIVTNPSYNAILTNALQCLPTISIVTPRSNLFDTATGIYVNPTNDGVAWERPVSMEWIATNDITGFRTDGGLRIHGAINRKMSFCRKKSFSLRFKDDYGPTKLNYDVFADPSATTSFDILVLRGGGVDQFLPYPGGGTKAQYVIDEFVRRSQLATGSPSPHGTFAHLYLDGLYWGLYNVVEKPAESFCEAYFGADKSTWDIIVTSYVAIEGNKDIWNAFVSLSYYRQNAPPPSNADYQFIQGRNPDRTPNPAYTNFLDVANYVDYLITQFWSGNSDWPLNNWYAVRSRNPGSTGFKWVVWDAERSLHLPYANLDTDNTGNFTGACGAYSWYRKNAEFCLFFADRAHKFMFNGGALTTNAVIPRYRELANIVGPAIVAESARWGDQSVTNRYTPADWTAERDYILNTYLPQRTGKVLQHFKDRGLYPLVDAPVFSRHGGIFTNGFSLTMTAPKNIYYTLDGRDPREYGTGNIVGTLYTGPLSPTYSVQVKARARSAEGVWSALNEALFVRNAPTTLRVTEVMYHPLPAQGGELGHGWTNDDFQFIEIQNVGSQTVGLAGTKFTDGITFDFTDGGVSSLAPGEFAVVVKNIAAFTNRYAALSGIKVAGQFQSRYDFATPQLAHNGERVVLNGPTNEVLDSFTYDDGSKAGWPTLADGYGRSLVRRDPASAVDPNDPAAWRASSQDGGSPGAVDPAPGPTPAILINEILAHTDWPQMDSVELYNPTAAPVDLSGWGLTDEPTNKLKYAIAQGTVIPAGGYQVLTSNDFGSVFLLSSAGEELVLSSPDLSYSHAVTFPASENGVSLGRYVTSQGAEHFPPQKSVTLGAANSGPQVGPVVISEIYYNPTNSPAGLAHEFLELSNISTQTVALSVPGAGGWRLNGVGFTFTNGTVMPPGGQILLVRDTTTTNAFRTANQVTNTVPIFIYTGALDNGGEFLHLEKPHVDALGVTNWISVDEVRYDDVAPWPVTPDGGGASLERIDYRAYGNDPINWRASTVAGGTPGQTDVQLVDLDGDGLPDWWEDLYLGGFLKGEAGADLDGDGFTNLQEYWARTDPRDSASRLKISRLERAVTGWQVSFATVSGKVYLVEYATNLTSATPWQILPVDGSTNGVTADGPGITVEDPTALDQPKRFYRIRLKP